MDSKSDIACIKKLRPTTTVTAKQLSDDPEKTVDIVGPSSPEEIHIQRPVKPQHREKLLVYSL
ncbi:MAG: hypothetical protein CM1200mP3_06930 [Chloroflexota bacterium]|nr:MAG: hypothetical protein CM1200mP3_06930 [Chloroflexota bacterium]